jgi:hypothetical protein
MKQEQGDGIERHGDPGQQQPGHKPWCTRNAGKRYMDRIIIRLRIVDRDGNCGRNWEPLGCGHLCVSWPAGKLTDFVNLTARPWHFTEFTRTTAELRSSPSLIHHRS